MNALFENALIEKLLNDLLAYHAVLVATNHKDKLWQESKDGFELVMAAIRGHVSASETEISRLETYLSQREQEIKRLRERLESSEAEVSRLTGIAAKFARDHTAVEAMREALKIAETERADAVIQAKDLKERLQWWKEHTEQLEKNWEVLVEIARKERDEAQEELRIQTSYVNGCAKACQ